MIQEEPAKGSELPWRLWLSRFFPHVCTHPFAPRHIRLWEWIEGLTPGERPRPRVDVWPRGGAKSSTGELGIARVGARLSRRFALYVSMTQEQADKHVQSVATLFEQLGVDRAINKFGHAKGWRRDQLRTANGFNVSGIGLDVATRGVKLDQYRPDLILFDDIDHQDDSLDTIKKKIGAISTAIIPAGASDCAILFLQNLIHEESIVSQLVDGRADFLHDREVPTVEAAVQGLATALVTREDGANVYRVTAGTPTWEGQNLSVCEAQINAWGLRAFLRESQQEVAGADGYFFDAAALQYSDGDPVAIAQRLGLRLCRAWDLAATEGGGDWTVGVLIGIEPVSQVVYVLDVIREQYGSDKVRSLILRTAGQDKTSFGAIGLRLPQDPGQAGLAQAEQFRKLLLGFNPTILPVTGKKAVRARGLADKVNSKNVHLLRAAWNFTFREEIRKFREDELDQVDDQVDAAADAFNHVFRPRTVEFS